MAPRTRSKASPRKKAVEETNGRDESREHAIVENSFSSSSSSPLVEKNSCRSFSHEDYAVRGGFHPYYEEQAELYIQNCRKYQVAVDPGIVIGLRTGWSRLQPSRHIFSEGSMLPLLGVLDHNKSVTHLNLSDSVMNITSSSGNGNSNARALSFILKRNQTIRELNLSNSGLDDVGLHEISAALKDNKFLEKVDLSGNYFSSTESLSDALRTNTTIKSLDVRRNALSFQELSTLLCACKAPHLIQEGQNDETLSIRKLEIMIEGNYAFEEILNSTSHGVAFLFSVLGCILLMSEVLSDSNKQLNKSSGVESRYWACAIYSFSLMFLFFCSSLYHSFFMLPTASRVLQILDHVGIYMLIAGSYTPFLLIGLHGHLSASILLVLEWLCVFCGIVFCTYADFSSMTTTIIELVVFVVMGCSVLFIWPSMEEALPPPAINLLVAGGAAYVVGIFFFIKGETKPIYHSVWHLFVILGASLHWFDVYFFIVNTRLGDVFQHCLLDLSDTIASGEIRSEHAAELLHLCMEGLNNESVHSS